MPLSTLRPQPFGLTLQDSRSGGSLLLSCETLSFSTPCRFIPALNEPNFDLTPVVATPVPGTRLSRRRFGRPPAAAVRLGITRPQPVPKWLKALNVRSHSPYSVRDSTVIPSGPCRSHCLHSKLRCSTPVFMATNAHQDELDFGRWQTPAAPYTIEYSLQVLEELRAYAAEGYKKIPHGGIEVGALLLGSVNGSTVRISEWRAIECAHARGPGFVLSEHDLHGLAQLLETTAADPVLREMAPVGWLHTHTRSALFLSEEDIAIHNRFFTEPSQFALVVTMGKDQPAQAGFFLRAADGAMDGSASPLVFAVPPNPAMLLGPPRKTAAPPRPAAAPTQPATPGPPPRRTAPSRARPARLFAGFGRLLPAADRNSTSGTLRGHSGGAAGRTSGHGVPMVDARGGGHDRRAGRHCRGDAAVVGAIRRRLSRSTRRRGAGPDRDSLGPWRAGGAARAESGARDPRRAVAQSVQLNQEEVGRGSVTYVRTGEDVELRLVLFENDRPAKQESTRFLGPPIAAPAAPAPAGPIRRRCAPSGNVCKRRCARNRRGRRGCGGPCSSSRTGCGSRPWIRTPLQKFPRVLAVGEVYPSTWHISATRVIQERRPGNRALLRGGWDDALMNCFSGSDHPVPASQPGIGSPIRRHSVAIAKSGTTHSDGASATTESLDQVLSFGVTISARFLTAV